MERALQAVISGEFSVRQASEVFNVPKSTLGRHAHCQIIIIAARRSLHTAAKCKISKFSSLG